jgi:hypothetical protein
MPACMYDVAACCSRRLYSQVFMQVHQVRCLEGRITLSPLRCTATRLRPWHRHRSIPASVELNPIHGTRAGARRNTRHFHALPDGATAPSDMSLQQVVAIDVEFIHYTPVDSEPQTAAAYVCLVDRWMNVLFKSFINPGLPSGARLNGGVRLTDIRRAPPLEMVGRKQACSRPHLS